MFDSKSALVTFTIFGYVKSSIALPEILGVGAGIGAGVGAGIGAGIGSASFLPNIQGIRASEVSTAERYIQGSCVCIAFEVINKHLDGPMQLTQSEHLKCFVLTLIVGLMHFTV